MRTRGTKGLWVAGLCALVLSVGAAPAQGAASDPLFLFTAGEDVPPGSGFEGSCGIGADSSGNFYISDYYHDTVDVFTGAHGYLTQLANVDPLDGPCGLAIDSSGHLYVNDYHRSVLRYTAAPYPITKATLFGSPTTIPAAEPTGISLDPLTANLYVDERTQIAHFDSSGALLGHIGGPSLKDGYGVAVSRYPPTAGFLYVPDAKDDVVKVYDPATDTEDPVAELQGPNGDFHSLRDSAIAVDRVGGNVYVADAIGPEDVNHPESTIQVFGPTGNYKGHLKFNVVDARPVGLAVDNSPNATQGRVYVTSGNSEGASVYAYGPGAATTEAPLCAPGGFCGSAGAGGGSGADVSASGPPSAASPAQASGASAASAKASEVSQRGTLRITVSGRLSPKRLPRQGAAPIAVTVGGEITTTDQSPPPKLKTLAVKLNRHGQIEYAGLPTCPYDRIQPASSQRALSACRSALVGEGSFEAEITLAGQQAYPTGGKLLLFNGKSQGKNVLFGQIYSSHPFATSFVIVFAIQKIQSGTYGTELRARLPEAMASWGNLTAIEMKLKRTYTYKGERHSYLSAACPAPKGFGQAAFPLAQASFGFAGGQVLSSVLNRSCRVG
jgi:hypothetical protein